MARPGRPASESYQSVRCSVSQSISYSSEAGIVEDEVDRAPIFSMSKSSVDVAVATGPLHKRDPAWAELDLRRSSSTNTHSKQNSGTLQQLRTQKWEYINPTNHLTSQNVDMHSPPALTERWISNMQRWSGCSGSIHSRSSTPDTVVSRGGSSHPSSLFQEASSNVALDSPMSKLASPPTTPSPFISPLQTPTKPPVGVLPSSSSSSSSSSSVLSVHHLQDSSPTPSPLQTSTVAHSGSTSPDLQLSSTEKEGVLENNLLIFQFPSPVPSSVNLAEANTSPGPGYHVDDLIEGSPSPGVGQLLDDEEVVKSPGEMVTHLTPCSPGEGQESRGGPSVCNLELPQQSGPVGRSRKSPLAFSLSDSELGNSCRCNINIRVGFAKAPNEAMAPQRETVEAAVQTMSPAGSWWNLKKDLSISNTGSHSILGSPPGSRLNLRSSVGSHSNLVSPSCSMFPVSIEEEEDKGADDPAQDIISASSHDMERRRSCLKTQAEEKDELGERRSSMKQVQWDENGMTWDIHGAPVDPKELSTAIKKHLALQKSPKPLRQSSKKKRAPKPPLISKMVTAIAAEISPSVMNPASTSSMEGEKEGTPEAAGERGREQDGGAKNEENLETPSRRSKVEREKGKIEEVCGEDGNPKSPSRQSGQIRKKSVIRSLRRPRWCGGSRKVDD
ncbi:flocculation protein FLO11 [Mugil cephalus]|uniref:flocculation protein FLO11 n=1 Tax=Mugil cephalus TaxID=48193 RepID=UPI001FB7EEE9|nr:flocculation protein FLO11 [Mugil cephalus]XP_047465182.1 flocculation protein FLO11 [Mugil cephalus]